MRTNPFPGMNPYLENPRHWRNVHHWLISGIARELNAVLPGGFATFIEDRVFVQFPRQDYYPDVYVMERPRPPRANGSTGSQSSGSVAGTTAVLEHTEIDLALFDAPYRFGLGSSTIEESYVEIWTTGHREELIAAIEVLSPTNKTKGAGRDEYTRKQRQFRDSSVHLLEIDLLRAGEPMFTPDQVVEIQDGCGAFDYLISLHRGNAGEAYEVWPVRLRNRLPRVYLPLTSEAGEVYLDLQAILNRAYEEGGMYRSTDYNAPLVPPLSMADELWAEILLREQGLR